ncbi:MAG: type II secretion system F family protein [Candidatus Thiodiazotropha sp.]|jgi:tight adherence protein C
MNAWNEISGWMAAWSSDAAQLRILFVTLLGLAGFSLALALTLFANTLLNPLKKRIDGVRHESNPKPARMGADHLLHRLGAFLIPKAEEKRAKLAYQLETGGYRSPRAMTYFYAIKLIGFMLAPLLVLGGVVLLTNRPILDYLSPAILAGALTFLAPGFWLKWAIRKRQQQLRNALPDALDLMVVCSEAGLGLSAAIQRVSDEIGVQHPELADELQLLMMQIRAGMDNRSALKELERRTDLDDISAFVTTLIQAMRFGTSIGQSLRVFADEMRDKRLQRAQEKAARLSLTMLMPIALCMLPMFFLILLGPAILSLLSTIQKLSGG